MLFFFFIFSISTVFGQVDADSLKAVLHSSAPDSIRLVAAKQLLIQSVRSKSYDESEIYANEYYRLAQSIGTEKLLGKALFNLGTVKWLQKDQQASNDFFSQAVPYLVATPDSAQLAKCYTKMGTNFLRMSDFENAIRHYELSAHIRETLGDSVRWVNNLINIAGCYYQMAEYDQAITYYHKALAVAEKTNNLRLMAYNYNNIGNIYMKTENDQKAIEYLLLALEVNRKLENHSEASKNLLNIANAYRDGGNPEQAEKYYLESAAIKERLEDREGLSDTYNSLGLIYKNLGRPDEALTYYHKAHDLIVQTNDRFALASVLSNIGTLYLEKQDRKAADYFLQSNAIAREIKARQLTLNNSENLIQYYRMFGEFEKALEMHEQVVRLNDSIYSEKTARAIAEMQTKYETEKKEKENELLLKDNQLHQANRKFFLLAISGLAILLMITFFFFRLKSKSLKQSKLLHKQEKELIRMELAKKEVEKAHLEDRIFAEKQLNRLQREKHKAEIERKNHELANSMLCVVNKNEVLTNIKKEILRGSGGKTNEDFIPDLIRLINNNIDLDQNWQKFKLGFEKVHPGFFDKLKQRYPDLSEVYIKLAAYIRIKLTTNEIAQLLNVTVGAVKKNRQRLRKKFGLSEDTSLSEFISSI